MGFSLMWNHKIIIDLNHLDTLIKADSNIPSKRKATPYLEFDLNKINLTLDSLKLFNISDWVLSNSETNNTCLIVSIINNNKLVFHHCIFIYTNDTQETQYFVIEDTITNEYKVKKSEFNKLFHDYLTVTHDKLLRIHFTNTNKHLHKGESVIYCQKVNPSQELINCLKT